MEKVGSFDSREGGVFGDILTGEKKHYKMKIGFLGCGYFEYWRMYPRLKETVEKDLEKIHRGLSGNFETVYPGMVDTLDSAEKAGRVFTEEGIGALVVAEGTYLPDFITLQAMEHVRGVPVVLFNSQTGADVSPEDDYQSTMRNSALIGISQLTGTFAKMGRKYHVVVGEIEEPAAYRKISGIIRAYEIRNRLRTYSEGIIGNVFRGMFDLEYDRAVIKGALGPEVVTIQPEHLLESWKQIPEEESRKEAKKLTERFCVKKIGFDDAVRSCRLGLAMRRLAARYRLDGLCFLGQHYIEKIVRAPARMGASMLMEEDRMMVSCEGDIGGLVMMQIMQHLTGNIPLQAEWGQFDEKSNAVFLLGHGIASPELAGSEEEVIITSSPEEWGFEGNGMNYQMILKPGPVTMGHFISVPGGLRMFVSEGESIEFPCLPCDEIHGMVRVKNPVKDYLREVLELGVAHHLVVVHGHIAGELAAVCRCMGIESAFLE